MTRQLLITARQLQRVLKTTGCVIFDCRFSLKDPDAGVNAYLDAHIPGALHAHLDNDLAGPLSAGSGRHPLPDPHKFAEFLARAGWQPGQLLVAYDDVGGAIAARLWWLLKYFDQDHAALLDGGIRAWQSAGLDLEQGAVQPQPQTVVSLSARPRMVLSTQEVAQGLGRQQIVLIDARAHARFAGEVEPIDAVAGHIPGAVNYPFSRNLNADGSFKSAAEIRAAMAPLIVDHGAADIVHMCGSGVTACENLFAAELSGIAGSRLYVGSWSEWIRDPSRPLT